MSKLGKKPIKLEDNMKVHLDGLNIKIDSPRGTLEKEFKGPIKIELLDNHIVVDKTNETKFAKSMYGTTRQIINNMVQGLIKDYKKVLSIEGIGYKATLQGNDIILNLGYSHTIRVEKEEGINYLLEGNTITVSGMNKEKVGLVAAKIRNYRKPDPYKGKGIRYKDNGKGKPEIIKLKEGKKKS